jgi:hypothetical protein
VDREQENELFRMLGEIRGGQEQILRKQEEISQMLWRHESRLNSLEVEQGKHRSYFKLIGGVVSALAAVGAAVVAWFK